MEAEIPHLLPDKHPQAQTLTKPQPKKKGQSKEMVSLSRTYSCSYLALPQHHNI